MKFQNDNEEIVACLSEVNAVSRECAHAYHDLVEWERTGELPFGALDHAIEELASLYGWSDEDAVKEWTFEMTAGQILNLCDECASHCSTVRRSVLLRELFCDPACGDLTVIAFAALADACGSAEAVSMVKALVKQRVAG